MTELFRDYWDWFLFDTLLWTGVLIGVALLLRRPVGRHLGAGAAYALWFLPLARLLFPPVQLPAWMQPSFLQTETAFEPAMAEFDPAMADFAAAAPAADAGLSQASFVVPVAPVPLESPIDFVTPLVFLWLLGAAIFLIRRFWLYGELRRELLEDARPMGEVGSIRLVETPAISGPMAFGVFDKVIALPDGFMASRPRQVRDLAIAHELAHHRGHDILVNVLIQPLFAVHWFNPLGWMGWTAMRRDQEAACDARVVASRSRDERAAYAAVIADFARRPQICPRPALAAPMACPVLGDKSIIHRLRNLPMTDDSRRRRMAARGAVGAALLALPMTASICYVGAAPALAGEAQPEMTGMVNPVAEPDMLADPAPIAEHAQLAFLDSEAFADALRDRMEESRERAEEARERAAEARERAQEAREEMAEARAELREIEREIARGDHDALSHRQINWNGKDWDEMSASERKAFEKEMKKLRLKFAEGGEFSVEMERALDQMRADGEMQRELRKATARVHAESRVAIAEAHASAAAARASAPRVVEKCIDNESPVTSRTDSRGRTVLYVCEEFGDRVALKAMQSARHAIARDRNLSSEARAEALRELDEEIAEHSR
ncbi:M56 family metallopeptidase [Qipengyuania sp. YG27]|uniref:M56 family metallopeptidase n=1 Tax=Qipengyuania mesophila TaxID=2867246 RepID=A0ABS7JQG3_9SPHN|nr:M56 family metallopeptidase [Qipengyuania mesophila]MBX7499882.1 M56 family metallopeptidase [Qipengyuania mesophila]